MKVFLILKHWQLFLIFYITAILFAVTIDSSFWILTLLLYDFTLVGWIYSIGKIANNINSKNKIENYHENFWFFLFYISFIPFGYFSHSKIPSNDLFMLATIIFVGFSAFKIVNFSAKAIKQNEINEELKFKDYLNEFLLIAFIPIGIWFIQPKMNKIMKNKKTPNT
jgi:hypothetical protein